MSFLFCFCLSIIGFNSVYAQLYYTGDKTLGSTLDESLNTAIPTSDNAIVMFGHTNGTDGNLNAASRGGYDYYIVKTDSAGNEIWNGKYGSSDDDYAFGGTEDIIGSGGFVMVGYTENTTASGDITSNSFGGYSDMWIAKVAADGSGIIWEVRIGGDRQDYATEITQTSDGGYLVAAFTESNPGSGNIGSQSARGGFDAFVIKLDANGNILWTRRFGTNQFENLEVISETPDGGFVVAGETYGGINGDKNEARFGNTDIWVVKYDNTYNMQWQKALGGSSSDNIEDVVVNLSNGRISFLSTTNSNANPGGFKSENSFGENDYWVVQLNSTGTLNWDKTYGGIGSDIGNSIAFDNDGSLLISGHSFSGAGAMKSENSFGDADFWSLSINQNTGNINWEVTHGGNDTDEKPSIFPGDDNGVFIVGSSASGISGNKISTSIGNDDLWLVKVNGEAINNTRYSLTSGTWRSDDTWSLAPGGPICCYPDEHSLTYVQSGHDISVDNDAFAKNLTIQNGASVFYGTNYREIKIYDSLIVENNASILNDAAYTSNDIEFRGHGGHLVVNDITNGVQTDFIKYFNPGNYTVSGSGKITVDQDIYLDSAVHWTNNLTGGFDFDQLYIYRYDTIINNGPLDVRQIRPEQGDFYFENNDLIDNHEIRFNNDVFNTHFVNNDTIITNNDIFLTGGNMLFENYGYLNTNGTRAVDNTSHFHNYTGATLVVNGGWPDRDINMHFHYPDNRVFYSGSGGQRMYPSVSGYWNLDLLGGGEKHATSDLHVFGDVSIQDSCRLDIAHHDQDAFLHGDIEITTSNSSPIDEWNQFINIVGDGDQYMQHSTRIDFDQLTIDKPSGKFFTQGQILINDILNLNSGVISNGDTAFINDGIVQSGGNANSYFEGPLLKQGNDAFTFHLGKNNKYRPLSISDVGHNSFVAEYFDADPRAIYDINQRDHVIDDVSHCEYWSFNRTAGTEDVHVNVSWGDPCGLTIYDRLNVARWNGSQWVNEGFSTRSGDINSGSITSDNAFHSGIIAMAQVTYPPEVTQDDYYFAEDNVITGNVLDNDIDTYGYNMNVSTTPAKQPKYGTVILNTDGSFEFTPDQHFFGVDTFYYEVCNDYLQPRCDTAAAVLWIESVNDLPTGQDSVITILEDSVYQFAANPLITNVSNKGASIYELGWLEQSERVFTSSPSRYQQIPEYLQGTRTIKTDEADRLATDEDWLNFTLTEPGWVYVLFYHKLNSPPDWLSQAQGWEIRYDTITRNWTNDVQIVFAKKFTEGPVTLGGNNAAGIDYWHTLRMYTVAVGPDAYASDVFAINDIDNHPLREIEVTGISGIDGWVYQNNPVTVGTIVANIDDLKFEPTAGSNGSSVLDFRVGDGSGNFSVDSYQLNAVVNPVNDKPSFNITDFTTDEDAGPISVPNHMAAITDGDDELDQALTVFISNDNESIFASLPQIDPNTGNLTFETLPDSAGVANLQVWLVDDGANDFPNRAYSDTLSFTITVNPINDPPVAVDDSYTSNEDVMLNENVLANDTDVENHNLTVNTSPVVDVSHGTLVLSANGNFAYTPSPDYNGSDTFTYELCDDGTPTECSQAVVNISILPIDENLPPTAENLSITIAANSDTTFCINASDPNGDSIFIANIVTPASNGNIILSNDNLLCLTYEPDKDFSGADQLELEICDGSICTSISINILVEAPLLNIYQAISPNNDGKNDTWIIAGIQNYPHNQVKLFNRYGDLVFNAVGYNNEDKIWNGQSNSGLVINSSGKLPDGTYFYVIHLGDGSKKISGYVVLHR